MTKPLLCPVCKERPVRTHTQYGVRADCCGLWSWGGAPLVSKETHEARKAAHAAFDVLWQSGRIKRKHAYSRLAQYLGLELSKCHIKQFDEATAKQVLAAVRAIDWQLKVEEARNDRDAILRLLGTDPERMKRYEEQCRTNNRELLLSISKEIADHGEQADKAQASSLEACPQGAGASGNMAAAQE